MKRIFPLLLIALLICGCIWARDAESTHREALHQLIERASAGDPKSLYQLATLHDRGYDTIPVDSLRSSALYLESARKGYAPAMNFIGFRYYIGEAINKDIDSAVYWIRKAADQGDITAAANLGYLLLDSPEIPHDEEEAAKWLLVAAEAGVNEAQLRLGSLMHGHWETLPSDSLMNMGRSYYEKGAHIMGVEMVEIAAARGEADAASLALLGDAYSKGLGVPYDHQKSIDYFYYAAEAGDSVSQVIIRELLDFFPDTRLPGE